MIRVNDCRNCILRLFINDINTCRRTNILLSGRNIMLSLRGIKRIRSTLRVNGINLCTHGFMLMRRATRALSNVLTNNYPCSRLACREIMMSKGLVTIMRVTICARASSIQLHRLLSSAKEQRRIIFHVFNASTTLCDVTTLRRFLLLRIRRLIIDGTSLLFRRIRTCRFFHSKILCLRTHVRFRRMRPAILICRGLSNAYAKMICYLNYNGHLLSRLPTRFQHGRK